MRLSRKAFDRLVEQAIAALPQEFAAWLEEVPVIVEDRPAKEDRQGMEESDAEEGVVGMYVGRSLGEQRESGELPPRVMIYRQPLMEACTTREQLAQEIRKTLVHELGHHAGMDEGQLEEKGYGPLEEEEEQIDWDLDEEDR